MNNKKVGKVTFKMVVKQGRDMTETSYETPATLFLKDNQYFLFYDEASVDDNSVTKCRYEFTADTLRIRRQGNVTLDQQHNRGAKTYGYMKTIYGNVETVIKTHQLTINKLDTKIELVVDYDLYLSEERTGNYQLTLVFEY